MINQNVASTNELLKFKQEQFHVSIRREKREEEFRKKRFVQKQSQVLDIVTLNPEDLEEQISQLMNKCTKIYQLYFPNQSEELNQYLNTIKQVQVKYGQQDSFIFCLFQNDFVDFLLTLANNQFDGSEIQHIATIILSNFFGQINKKSNYFYSTYTPYLNVKGASIIQTFGRLLRSYNKETSLASIYAIGNLFADKDFLVTLFKEQFGFKYLLQLSENLDLIIWVIYILSKYNITFNFEETQLAINIIDSEINNANRETLTYCFISLKNFTFTRFDSISLIINMKSFNKITEIIQSKQELQDIHYDAFELLCSFSITENLQQLIQLENKYDLINLYISYIYSTNKQYRYVAYDALINICENHQNYFIPKLIKQQGFIEKIIKQSYSDTQKEVELSLELLLSLLKLQDIKVNQEFIELDIIQLLNNTLTYLNSLILTYSLKILLCLLETIEYYQPNYQIPANDQMIKSRVYILGLLNQYSITQQLTEVFQNVQEKDEEIRENIIKCLDIIEAAENNI